MACLSLTTPGRPSTSPQYLPPPNVMTKPRHAFFPIRGGVPHLASEYQAMNPSSHCRIAPYRLPSLCNPQPSSSLPRVASAARPSPSASPLSPSAIRLPRSVGATCPSAIPRNNHHATPSVVHLHDSHSSANGFLCHASSFDEAHHALGAGPGSADVDAFVATGGSVGGYDGLVVSPRILPSEAVLKALSRAVPALRRYGWFGFWFQLILSTVSGVVLLFSVGFTTRSGPRASLYLTLFGILAGFLSAFWNYTFTRTAAKMQATLNYAAATAATAAAAAAAAALAAPTSAPMSSSAFPLPLDSLPAPPPPARRVRKQEVMSQLSRGATINLLGLGAALLSVQALVGQLVAKTLSSASANPFIASAAGAYNPVLALDVFLVQAAVNALTGHFLSLLFVMRLTQVVGGGGSGSSTGSSSSHNNNNSGGSSGSGGEYGAGTFGQQGAAVHTTLGGGGQMSASVAPTFTGPWKSGRAAPRIIFGGSTEFNNQQPPTLDPRSPQQQPPKPFADPRVRF